VLLVVDTPSTGVELDLLGGKKDRSPQLCVDQVRFGADETKVGKMLDPDTDQNITLLSATPTTYDTIEVDLTAQCNGKSWKHNDNKGQEHTAAEAITLTFQGPFTLEAGTQIVALDFTDALDAAEATEDDSQIKAAVEQTRGHARVRK
jgi:hypothetical protein